jgi:hypothetical protein
MKKGPSGGLGRHGCARALLPHRGPHALPWADAINAPAHEPDPQLGFLWPAPGPYTKRLGKPKAHVVVAIVGIVGVALRRPAVARVVDPRAAAQHAPGSSLAAGPKHSIGACTCTCTCTCIALRSFCNAITNPSRRPNPSPRAAKPKAALASTAHAARRPGAAPAQALKHRSEHPSVARATG